MGKETLSLFWWVPFGKVPEVEPSKLHEQLRSESPPQILDVRSGVEFRKGHIEGAVHVPISKLRSRVDEFPFDRHRPIVTICLTAHKSIPAIRFLNAKGFKNIAQLAGGMVAWRRNGFPTKSEKD